MSKSEIISRLMDEMSSQNDWYLAAIGVLVTLTLFVSGFSIYAQLKLSDKQITKLKTEIKNDLVEEFSLEDVSKINSINNSLTGLILTDLRNVTNRLMLDSESYTTVFLIHHLIRLIGYVDLLRGRKISNADFIDEIASVFVMIDGWEHRSSNNKVEEPVQIYIYHIYTELVLARNWQDVKDYNRAINDFKNKVRPLKAFKYLNLDNKLH